MKNSFILVLLMCCFGYLQAQSNFVICTDSTFCVPSVYGMPRTKGLEIKQEQVLNYAVKSISKSPGIEDSQNEIQKNRRWDIRLKVPLILKPNLKIALGLNYFQEEYYFDDIGNNDYPFYASLQDKPLRSIGAALYMIKPFLGNKYFLMRVSGNLNGDYKLDEVPKSDFLKLSVAPLIGWKASPYTSYAFGLAYTNNFGRQSIYPILSYNHTFNTRWGLESLLPAKAKIRYTQSDKAFWAFTTELNGASYNVRLDDSPFSESESLHLRKSEIRFLFSLEREIHDWLWFGLEAGLRTNLEFSLRESGKRSAPTIIDNTFNSALIFSASLFIVPPRKLLP